MNRKLITALEKGDYDVVNDIIIRQNHRLNYPYYELYYASMGKNPEIMKLILNLPYVIACCDIKIIVSCCIKNFEIIMYLMNEWVLHDRVNLVQCMSSACEYNNLDIVKYLTTLPDFNPTIHNNLFIKRALQSGNIDIAKLLLTYPGVNPLQDINETMDVLEYFGDKKCIDFLTSLSGIVTTVSN